MAGNTFELRGDFVIIHIDKNKKKFQCLIDFEDLEKVMNFPTKWVANNEMYVSGRYKSNSEVGRKPIPLHRFIMDAPYGMVVDHINHNPLDNRKENLRIVTKAQNCQNKRGPQTNSKSGVRGVVWNKLSKKWRAQYKTGGVAYHVGSFDTKEEAEKAIKLARKKAFPYDATV